MSTRNKILIVAGGGIVLLLLTVFIALPIFQSDSDNQQQTNQQQPSQQEEPTSLQPLPSDQQAQSQNPPQQNETAIEPVPSQQQDTASDRAAIDRLTRYFVERFGSYSNFSGFENVTSLRDIMTEDMRQYADSLIQETRREQSGYYGVTTKLVNADIEQYSRQDSATMSILVQREVQDGLDAASTMESRSGRVELVFQNDEWYIDGLYYN